MRVTLDHNCIIHLENQTSVGVKIRMLLSRHRNQHFVVNIGASEMRQKGITPDHYEKFEELLEKTGIDGLPRLNPIGIFDVTFFDRCVFANEDMKKLVDEIESILFPNQPKIDISEYGIDSPQGRKWLNHICDVHTMWCHIWYGNDVFMTSDLNFTKKTKLPKLIALGAKRICSPEEL